MRAFLFVPYPQLQSPGILLKAFYYATGFGHQAVMVFFVLSGFLVGGGVVQKIQDGTFVWKDYLVNRFSRLYPVLIAALVVGGCLDYVGCHYFNSAGLYTIRGTDGVIGVINYNASQRLGPKTFLVNLFMLQGIHGATFGTNGPLWSLSMEFWYYLMFPVAALCLRTRTWKRLFCYNSLFLVGIVAFLPLEYDAYFVIWLMGVAAAAIRVPVRRALLWAAMLLAALANSRAWIGGEALSNALIGLSCALVICAVKNGDGFPSVLAGIHERLSAFSYSVYLFHFPVLVFCLSVLNQSSLWNSSGGRSGRFGLFVVLMMLCVTASYVLSLFTEAKTPEVRSTLFSCLSIGRDRFRRLLKLA
jgi:peptidoglycan/LPS O-acetylase OafA/YrhL